ncbi:MAG: histidine kinase [Spirochaetales bacterium]|nr:histidine kinase [Spirochaetales bacterium]
MAKQGKKVRIFSALEVANICGVVNQTAINWIKNGHLKAFTTPGGQYRVYAEDLHEFLSSRGMRVPDEIEEIAGGRCILIVEDEENLNNMLKELFLRTLPDYEVFQALDGYEAGRLISERRPSIIVLDMSLPGVDGHELIGRIKQDENLKNPRIIAMSGMSGEIAEREKILEEGADLFLTKPVNSDELVESVRTLLEGGQVRG